MGTVEERHKEIVELMEKNNKILKFIEHSNYEEKGKEDLVKLMTEL